MPLTMPPRRRDASEPREMVRVQLKDNDIRSYERSDAEAVMAANPGAFILGDQATDDDHEAAEPDRSTARGRRASGRSAPNKARTTKPAESAPPPAAETGSEPPPADPAGQAETKSEPPTDEGKGS